MVDLHLHSPIRLHGMVLKQLSTRTTLPFTNDPHNLEGGTVFIQNRRALNIYLF
jgi:hypothetical protein